MDHLSEKLEGQLLDSISPTQGTVDFCIDYVALPFLVTYEPLWKVIISLVNKGIRLRFITKVKHENISYCNMLMKYSSQVFHDDKVKGNS